MIAARIGDGVMPPALLLNAAYTKQRQSACPRARNRQAWVMLDATRPFVLLDDARPGDVRGCTRPRFA